MSDEDIEASKAPLMDHLIELRSRLIKALLGFAVAFIIAAVLTPPDVLSQASLALPLLLLYEGSIIAVAMVEKNAANAKADAAGPTATPPPPEGNPAE